MLRFDGFRYDNITPTDIDAIIDYHGSIWIIFEAKLAGAQVPFGQRLALERLVNDGKRAGKHCCAMVVEHHVRDRTQDVYLRDCTVRELYTTEKMVWRPPTTIITAKQAADSYITFYEKH